MVHNKNENISRKRDRSAQESPMSVIQRGLRSSLRSKAIMAQVRGMKVAEEEIGGRRAGLVPGLGTRREVPPRPASARTMPDLTPDQQAAAEHLAEVFAAAEFESWARGGPGGDTGAADPLHPSPEALIARAAYRAAMRAVPVLLSPLIVHVCCLGLPLADWAEQKRLAKGQAEAALRQALTHLVRHFEAMPSA
jgi:hypothetical protein